MSKLVFKRAPPPSGQVFLKFVYSGKYCSPLPPGERMLSSSATEPDIGDGPDRGAYTAEWSPTAKVTQEEKDETARLYPNSRIDGNQSRSEAPSPSPSPDPAPAILKRSREPKNEPEEQEDPASEDARKKKKRREGGSKSRKKRVASGSTATMKRADATEIVTDPEEVQKVLVEAGNETAE